MKYMHHSNFSTTTEASPVEYHTWCMCRMCNSLESLLTPFKANTTRDKSKTSRRICNLYLCVGTSQWFAWIQPQLGLKTRKRSKFEKETSKTKHYHNCITSIKPCRHFGWACQCKCWLFLGVFSFNQLLSAVPAPLRLLQVESKWSCAVQNPSAPAISKGPKKWNRFEKCEKHGQNRGHFGQP